MSLSRKQTIYQHRRRARLYREGLTARGTERKLKLSVRVRALIVAAVQEPEPEALTELEARWRAFRAGISAVAPEILPGLHLRRGDPS